MKALIFAAGLGTRLKPLTETVPKALVSVNGKPLLEHVILRLKNVGVSQIIINIHHFPDEIINFVHSKQNFDIEIAFSDERDLLLDTGGGIKKASWFFNDGRPFFVHNVDIFSNVDLNKMYAAHLQSQALSTLFVSDRKTSRYLLFDTENRLAGWYNKQTEETRPGNIEINASKYNQLAFNGIHIISPQIFSLMDNWQGKFSIIDFYLSTIHTSNIVSFQQKDAMMIDVGKMDALQQVENSGLLRLG